MGIFGKEVSNDAVVGGTITGCEIWGPIEVLGADGLNYVIHTLEGHSGPENVVYETQRSVALRAAKTRKKRKEEQ